MVNSERVWNKTEYKLVKNIGLRYIYVKTFDNREGIIDIAPPFYGLLGFPKIHKFQSFDFYEFKDSKALQTLVINELDIKNGQRINMQVQSLLIIMRFTVYPIIFVVASAFILNPLNQFINSIGIPPILLLIIFFFLVRWFCFDFLIGRYFRKKIETLNYCVNKKIVSIKLKKRYFYSFVNVMMTFMTLFLAIPIVSSTKMGLGTIMIALLLNFTFIFNSSMKDGEVYTYMKDANNN